MVIKAVAGGGGRGMRAVSAPEEVERAYERCQSEAQAAFGIPDVFVEQRIRRARHVEVQIVGDGSGRVSHLGERECSIQRRHQKLIEIAPSPALSPDLRERLTDGAVRLAEEVRFASLGTFEFLLDADADDGTYAFIEANPRLQVEHTVTEEVTGVDLVKAQLELAGGRSLLELGTRAGGRAGAARLRDAGPRQHGDHGRGRERAALGRYAHRLRAPFGSRRAGRLLRVHRLHDQPELRLAPRQARRSLPLGRLRRRRDAYVPRALRVQDRRCGDQRRLPPRRPAPPRLPREAPLHRLRRGPRRRALVASEGAPHRRLFFDESAAATEPPAGRALAGAKIDASDPLAVLHHGKAERTGLPAAPTAPPSAATRGAVTGPPGTVTVSAPVQGTIVSVDVTEGDLVRVGQPLLVMESMKMEHVVEAETSGIVRQLAVAAGDTVFEGHPLAFIEEAEVAAEAAETSEQVDLDYVRPDLAEVQERHAVGLDAARPDAVARRRKTGQRTARENVDDLVRPRNLRRVRSHRHRGAAAAAPAPGADRAHTRRRDARGDRERQRRALRGVESRCVVMSYDYTVLAGTQGLQNHRKKDRMFELAEGVAPAPGVLHRGRRRAPRRHRRARRRRARLLAFSYFGRLSGLVPLVGINSGRCFAGNAALLGCCDVVIATENSNIGMGGPAMIEAGGSACSGRRRSGRWRCRCPTAWSTSRWPTRPRRSRWPSSTSPTSRDPSASGPAPTSACCARVIPENRLRIYDVRKVIETLADSGSRCSSCAAPSASAW